jgi:hypothetical protein
MSYVISNSTQFAIKMIIILKKDLFKKAISIIKMMTILISYKKEHNIKIQQRHLERSHISIIKMMNRHLNMV